MTGHRCSIAFIAVSLVSATALLSEGCRAVDGKTSDRPASAAAISAAPASVVEQPVARFVQATGSLIADQRAEVAADAASSGAHRARHARRGRRRTGSPLLDRNGSPGA